MVRMTEIGWKENIQRPAISCPTLRTKIVKSPSSNCAAANRIRAATTKPKLRGLSTYSCGSCGKSRVRAFFSVPARRDDLARMRVCGIARRLTYVSKVNSKT